MYANKNYYPIEKKKKEEKPNIEININQSRRNHFIN